MTKTPTESKVLIMNETKIKPFLSQYLCSSKPDTEYIFFKHEKLKIDNSRILNLIEFSKVKFILFMHFFKYHILKLIKKNFFEGVFSPFSNRAKSSNNTF